METLSLDRPAVFKRIESCPRCKHNVPVHAEATSIHVGIYCDKFGHWVRWAKKSDETHVKGVLVNEAADS